MDLTYAVTALGTSFGDVGTKLIQVGLAAMSALMATGLVYSGLRFILKSFGVDKASLRPEERTLYESGQITSKMRARGARSREWVRTRISDGEGGYRDIVGSGHWKYRDSNGDNWFDDDGYFEDDPEAAADYRRAVRQTRREIHSSRTRRSKSTHWT